MYTIIMINPMRTNEYFEFEIPFRTNLEVKPKTKTKKVMGYIENAQKHQDSKRKRRRPKTVYIDSFRVGSSTQTIKPCNPLLSFKNSFPPL
jgi:hypothetical protein